MIEFSEALRVWIRVAIHSFGGPAGQIAVMHKILVEEKKWISEERFLHAMNYCMLLPGPEAQQLATYIGYLLHRTKGGLVAGSLFILPGFISILGLSLLYALFRDASLVKGLFYGIKPAVLAIVVGAVLKIGKKTMKNNILIMMAAAAFVAIFFFDIAFPLIVIAAGSIGWLGGKLSPEKFSVMRGKSSDADSEESTAYIDRHITTEKPRIMRTLGVASIWLSLWFVPVGTLFATLGRKNIFVQEAFFFSKTAVVTFGGAYSVLAYIAQRAVETYGWLQAGEMLDGLGMAETTPGPLIQVVQFVGFMGAFRNAGGLEPLTAGILGSILSTWVTFTPCFLFIFTGAPYIEYLRGNANLSSSLSGITAAVVGVVLNLGVWFSLNTLFTKLEPVRYYGLRFMRPDFFSVDFGAVAISAIAFALYFYWKLDMIKTILICATIGIVGWFAMPYLR